VYDVYSWVHFKTTQTLISIFGNDGSREKTFAERFVCKTNSNMGWVKIQVVGLWMAVEQVVVDLGYILVLHLDSLVILLLSWGWCSKEKLIDESGCNASKDWSHPVHPVVGPDAHHCIGTK